jgi:hypothetical protein
MLNFPTKFPRELIDKILKDTCGRPMSIPEAKVFQQQPQLEQDLAMKAHYLGTGRHNFWDTIYRK